MATATENMALAINPTALQCFALNRELVNREAIEQPGKKRPGKQRPRTECEQCRQKTRPRERPLLGHAVEVHAVEQVALKRRKVLSSGARASAHSVWKTSAVMANARRMRNDVMAVVPSLRRRGRHSVHHYFHHGLHHLHALFHHLLVHTRTATHTRHAFHAAHAAA